MCKSSHNITLKVIKQRKAFLITRLNRNNPVFTGDHALKTGVELIIPVNSFIDQR